VEKLKMNSFRKLMNLIENTGEAMYLGTDRTKSVSLSRLPEDVAELLRNNPDTVGRFEFIAEDDDSDWSFFAQTGPFMDGARRAVEAYTRDYDTKFVRLVVGRYKIDN
jgi:hypothetical protein